MMDAHTTNYSWAFLCVALVCIWRDKIIGEWRVSDEAGQLIKITQHRRNSLNESSEQCWQPPS